MKCEECENLATIGPWCEECYAKGVNAIKVRIPPALKPIPSGRTIAEPLSYNDSVKQEANKAALNYCETSEFVCHLGGGDPKATIHNLRMMAFYDGYLAGVVSKPVLD